MSPETEQSEGTLPRVALIAMILLAGAAGMALLTGVSLVWVMALEAAVTEGGAAAAVLAAAGGYGYLLIRRIAPVSAPIGLRVTTSCVLGLWMFSTVIMLVGSVTHGLLKPWFWWPIVGAGIVLTAWQGRKKMESWRPQRRFDGRALVWVVVALIVGMWLGGAARPPGCFRAGEAYDVLEYHLQVPREFHDAQHVGPLPHNVYSYYPLGVEMLSLLAMCLRGGAYAGMYLSKMLHGALGVLGVAAIYLTLKRDDDTRGRFSTALLSATPMLIYLSWMALSELGEICCLVLGLLWLRHWIAERSFKSAVCLGLMLGASCAVKYLSVGLIVAPVLAAMAAVSLAKGHVARFAHIAAAGAATIALFSPWLIRNTVHTGNPVFPLATNVLGRGHWSGESQQRWTDGHGPDVKPPVPPPPEYQERPTPSRALMFWRNFIGCDPFGPIMLLIAGIAVCVLIAETGRRDPWDLSLVGVAAIQLAVWTSAAHQMPSRFIVVAMVPATLLAGGVLARLSRVRTNPLRRNAPPPVSGKWGLSPAIAIFAAAVLVNVVITYNVYQFGTAGVPVPPFPGDHIAGEFFPYTEASGLPEGSRILLVGDAKAFYFPTGTIYATAFDAHPLAELAERGLTGEQMLRELRSRGVTHIWVDWQEIWRLANTYGFPAVLSEDLFERRAKNLPPSLGVLEKLERAGLRRIKDIRLPVEPTSPDTRPAATRPAATAPSHDAWPIASIYALPQGAAPETQPATTQAH